MTKRQPKGKTEVARQVLREMAADSRTFADRMEERIRQFREENGQDPEELEGLLQGVRDARAAAMRLETLAATQTDVKLVGK